MEKLDEEVLKTKIARVTVSSHLLEDQIHLISERVAGVKAQAAKHEITIRFLEPSSFENIATEENVWINFMNEQAGPS